MMNVKRFAAALFVYACGGTEVPTASVPCPTSPADASVSVADAQADVVTPSVDAAIALLDAGVPEEQVDPDRARDLLLANIASLALKTIASPPPPVRDPPRPPSYHGLDSHQMQVPLVYESSLRASDGLPPEVVRRMLRQSFGRYRYCYEESLRAHPDAKGKVVTRLAIDGKGDVVLSEPLSSTMSSELALCIVRATRSLTFPRTEGGAVVAIELGLSFAP